MGYGTVKVKPLSIMGIMHFWPCYELSPKVIHNLGISASKLAAVPVHHMVDLANVYKLIQIKNRPAWADRTA